MYTRYNSAKNRSIPSSSKASRNSQISEECPVCCQDIPSPTRKAIFAIGTCNHPICYYCCTKIRTLCKQNECAICRHKITEVIFTSNPHAKFSDFDKDALIFDEDCFYEKESIKAAVNLLLKERCNCCLEYFNSLNDLEAHLMNKHALSICNLCSENLKVLSNERKYYNSSQLQSHLDFGDECAYKGHPVCKFDDIRFMDDEALKTHIRNDHFTCTYCSDSYIFNKYSNLYEHFQTCHYLCEEGECGDTRNRLHAPSVFTNAIDYKAHRAQQHCATKSEAKSVRTISSHLNFNMGRGAAPESSFYDGFSEEAAREDDAYSSTAQSVPSMDDFPALVESSDDFPLNLTSGAFNQKSMSLRELALGNANNSNNRKTKLKNQFSFRVGRRGFEATCDSEFPALCSEQPTPPKIMTNGFLNAAKRQTTNSLSLPSSSKQSSSEVRAKAPVAATAPKEYSFESDDFPALPSKSLKNRYNKQSSNNLSSSTVPNTKVTKTPQEENKIPLTNMASFVANKPPPPGYEKIHNYFEYSLSSLAQQVISEDRENSQMSTRNDVISKDTSDTKTNNEVVCEIKKQENQKFKKEPFSKMEGNKSQLNNQPKKGNKKVPKKNEVHQISEKANHRHFRINGQSTENGHEENKIKKDKEKIYCGNKVIRHNYIEPKNYSERVKNHYSKLKHILGDKFEKHEKAHYSFLNNEISADEFYRILMTELASVELKSTFPELIALLPNIAKQNQLFIAYKKKLVTDQNKIEKRRKDSPKFTGKWKMQDDALEFIVCPFCGQLLMDFDSLTHTKKHSEQSSSIGV